MAGVPRERRRDRGDRRAARADARALRAPRAARVFPAQPGDPQRDRARRGQSDARDAARHPARAGRAASATSATRRRSTGLPRWPSTKHFINALARARRRRAPRLLRQHLENTWPRCRRSFRRRPRRVTHHHFSYEGGSMLNRIVRVAAACAVAAFAVSAVAQTYPVKPVRIVVGASRRWRHQSIIARMLADKLTAVIGQPRFVVENKPGAPTPSLRTSPPSRRPTATRCWWGRHGAGDRAAPGRSSASIRIRTSRGRAHGRGPRTCSCRPYRGREQRAAISSRRSRRSRTHFVRIVGIGSTPTPRGGRGVHSGSRHEGRARAVQGVSAGARRSRRRARSSSSFDTTSSAMAFIKGGKVKALAVMTRSARPSCRDVPDARRGRASPRCRNDDVVRLVRHRGHAEGRRQLACTPRR